MRSTSASASPKPSPQQAPRVRRDLDPGADLPQLGGLLEDGDVVEPGAAQEERSRQSADAASDDRDAYPALGHGAVIPRPATIDPCCWPS
jgi:hypothetical protein